MRRAAASRAFLIIFFSAAVVMCVMLCTQITILSRCRSSSEEVVGSLATTLTLHC